MSKFNHTLCIFETAMPIRSNQKILAEEMYTYWQNNDIQKKIYEKRHGAPHYILHDGPPYANGDIHLGHAYNKIMKDIVIRSHHMMGYNTYTVPGWDCHGLPIEHKVSQLSSHSSLADLQIACAKYAESWVEIQKESFKKLGILMDWENPYKTMDKSYQGTIITAFGELFNKGYISRANKTIPWCCGCKTALASAEIEYKNSKDPSLYVLLRAKQTSIALQKEKKENIFFVIWTTTPWTLPLNRAIMLKKNASYILLKDDEKYLIIGKNCLSHFSATTKKEFEIIAEYNSEELSSEYADHPFEKNSLVPIILDDAVETTEGTACVHTAPGCGPIDYEIGVKNNLEIYSPISDDGKYTENIKIQELVGMPITEGQIWAMRKLQELGTLYFKTSINHSFPHCWRSHEKLIFRATPQWFCNLEKNNFKTRALEAIETISFYPEAGKSTLKATVSNRWEWCISRQRNWGVPIIALIQNETNEYWTSIEFITLVADRVTQEGLVFWDNLHIADPLFYKIIPETIRNNANLWRKERDILDVWFDSGISHTAVLKKAGMFPADLYLEGIDQHRGWFQSSLLTSVALYDQAPMKTIVSCGYTVDEKGQKMSKSLGNGISPETVINKIGLDCLRTWVAGVQIGGDIVVSDKIFSNIQEIYRKIRNTCRFAVQNVTDFNPLTEFIPYKKLNFLNQYTVEKLYEYNLKAISAYQHFNFPEVLKILIDLSNTFLSSFYFDMNKDILYCAIKNSQQRKEVQTVLFIALDMITKLIAPICINTAEDITNFYHSLKGESIHLGSFAGFDYLKHDSNNHVTREILFTKEFVAQELYFLKNKKEDTKEFWENLFGLREKIFKAIEVAREQNVFKQGIEAIVRITYQKNSKEENLFNLIKDKINQPIEEFFEFFFLVSAVQIIMSDNTEQIEVKKHQEEKCQRCWKYGKQSKDTADTICSRCFFAIQANQ
jgi:isoleucyl-tRNA synthetase